MHYFKPVVKLFLSFCEAVRQQTFDVICFKSFKSIRRVVIDGLVQAVEQVLVINNVSEILVLFFSAVYPADGLKQSVVLHLLVYIEIGTGGSIKASEQF